MELEGAVGAGAVGAGAVGAGAVGAGAVGAGAVGAGAGGAVTMTVWAVTGGLAGGEGTLATAEPSIPIGGAPLRRTGIAVPADAAERPGGLCSRGVPAGLSARPIAKQHAKTAAHRKVATRNARTYIPAGPLPT